METDAFFYRLFNQLPETLFDLLGLPEAQAKAYRFDSVELKKAFRIDGLFVPKKRKLPLNFVEVQFQRLAKFMQEWVAVAIFPSRNEDLKQAGPYEDFLQSKRVRRIYWTNSPCLTNRRRALEFSSSFRCLPMKSGVLPIN